MKGISYFSKLIILGVAVALWGCSGREEAMPPQPVVRLDLMMQELAHADTATVADSVAVYRPEIDAMFKVLGVDSPSAADVMAWSRGDAVRVFQPAVDSVYASTAGIEAMIGGVTARAARELPELPELRYATVTWGSMRPMVRVDSVMLIALNHYLGSDYPGYTSFEAYRRRDKTPAAMPYDLAASLAATQYPMTMTEPATLLNWMLYEGALVEVRMRLVPEANLAMAIGVDEAQLDILEANTKDIWREMAAMRLIYDTDPLTIDRYLGASPSTPLLQGRAPGRTGRYIGYRIVKAWLSRYPDTPLTNLLLPTFYASPSTLADSRFAG